MKSSARVWFDLDVKLETRMSVFFKKFSSFVFGVFSLLSSAPPQNELPFHKSCFPSFLFFVFLMFSKKEGKQQQQQTFFIATLVAFSVSVGIILTIYTYIIHRKKREKERLAEKASSSSQSDFEEEEE